VKRYGSVLPLLYTNSESYVTEDGLRVVRVIFAGQGGSFSEGNHHGNQMRDVIRQVVERDQPDALIVDVRQLEYSGGDWIIWGCLAGREKVGRVCLIASHQTSKYLFETWQVLHLDSVIAIFSTLEQAEDYVRSTKG
jgi:hypothetical protein